MKAIETRYNGYRFRSRLEARWAVFFDSLGIRYEYEIEGFELPSGKYLPDFLLPDLDDGAGCWFESKGPRPTVLEVRKFVDLCSGSGRHGLMFYGGVGEIKWKVNRDKTKLSILSGCAGIQTMRGDDSKEGVACFPYPLWDDEPIKNADPLWGIDSRVWTWTEGCDDEIAPWVAYGDPTPAGTVRTLAFGHDGQLTPAIYIGGGRERYSTRLMKAYSRARSARFEHGEAG